MTTTRRRRKSGRWRGRSLWSPPAEKAFFGADVDDPRAKGEELLAAGSEPKSTKKAARTASSSPEFSDEEEDGGRGREGDGR